MEKQDGRTHAYEVAQQLVAEKQEEKSMQQKYLFSRTKNRHYKHKEYSIVISLCSKTKIN